MGAGAVLVALTGSWIPIPHPGLPCPAWIQGGELGVPGLRQFDMPCFLKPMGGLPCPCLRELLGRKGGLREEGGIKTGGNVR